MLSCTNQTATKLRLGGGRCLVRLVISSFPALLEMTAHMLHKAGATPFVYFFNRTPKISVNNRNTTEIGAFHGSEVPFVFHDTFELEGSEVELSSKMVEAWDNIR